LSAVSKLTEDLHPYVVFLPASQKSRILSAIFGSKAAVDILRFSLSQGVSKEIYQKDLVQELSYSNKTIIETLKSLTRLGVLSERMKKAVRKGRTVWVKVYQLTDAGKWFALLIAKEKDLSGPEKKEILQSIFRGYVKWVRSLSEDLHLSRDVLKKIFAEEMK
jgi:DNA-binding PadR family transcriptional regulator